MFWSDLGYEVGIEAIGLIDSSLDTVGIYAKKNMDDPEDDFDRGVVFYRDENEIVVGVLLWNIFNHMQVAKRVVAENRRFEDLTEVAKLFDFYKSPADLAKEEEDGKTEDSQ